MDDDAWGDKATREHLRPGWWPDTTIPSEPEPETVDIEAVLDGDTLDTDAVRTFLDDQPDQPEVLPENATTEPTTVDSEDAEKFDNSTDVESVPGESDDDLAARLRREPAADSIAGRVWGMFKTFPKERFHRNEIAATLDIANDQATSSVLHLQRLFLPVHGDGSGNYWYDEDQPVADVIKKRAEWYAEYRKPRANTNPKKKTPMRTKTTNRTPSVAELLNDIGFHDRAVILFEALARAGHYTKFGPNARVRVPTLQTLTPEEAALFPTNSIISAVNRYLETIDSVTQAGPMKILNQHPNSVEPEVQRQAAAALMTVYGVNRRLSPTPNRRDPETQGTVREETTPSRGDLERVEWEPVTPEPRSTVTDDLIDSVDDDRLAKALANGMWARYEWALTALGKAQEELIGMQEALRVRDQEIERLRGYLATHPQFSIKDVARDLLASDESGSR